MVQRKDPTRPAGAGITSGRRFGIAIYRLAVGADPCVGPGADTWVRPYVRAAESLDCGIPPMNRELAVAEALGGRRPARRHLEHFVEQPARRGVERLVLAHHPADVDVDIVRHALRRARV